MDLHLKLPFTDPASVENLHALFGYDADAARLGGSANCRPG